MIRGRAPAARRERLRAKPARPTRPRWPAPKNRTDTVRLAVSVRKISLLRTRLWSFGASHIACAAEQPQPKRFRRGTHRVADPRETLARVRPYMARMGLTRLGNITGLDRIGIPVAIAVRPNSRSVSVSQGKLLDLSSIDDLDCRALLGRYASADIPVRVWNVTTDLGMATFLCEIRDQSAGDPRKLRRFHGSGCHADRIVALNRALTEAAQTRLTYIAGIRDDLSPAEYEESSEDEIGDALLDALAMEAEPTLLAIS